MKTLQNLLVVLGDEPDEARYVLEKAVQLGRATGAGVHVVRIVYESIAELSARAIESSPDLKSFILQAEESITEELVEDARLRLPGLDTVTLWNPRHWEAVLHAATQCGAELILQAASTHSRFGGVIRTPDDWNLLRQAPVPVLLVKPQAWVAEPMILCAVDAFDPSHDALSTAVLRAGDAMATHLGGELHVVVAYPLFERWVGELGALRDYDSLKQDVEREIRDRVVALAEGAGVSYRRLYADEGRVDMVIATLAARLPAELVVVGTHARAGLTGMMLGNTSERLLHELETDVLTVHAPATQGAARS